MRNVAIVVLVIIVCVLWFSVRSKSIEIKVLQRNLDSVNQASAAVRKAVTSASLELQGRCARQALERFNVEGWNKERVAGFTDHYNTALNRCFVEIDNTEATAQSVMNTRVVMDAFEGTVYGRYTWINFRARKDLECFVKIPSGDKAQCHSSEEFDGLIKQYMQ